jgi:hypothetical protein
MKADLGISIKDYNRKRLNRNNSARIFSAKTQRGKPATEELQPRIARITWISSRLSVKSVKSVVKTQRWNFFAPREQVGLLECKSGRHRRQLPARSDGIRARKDDLREIIYPIEIRLVTWLDIRRTGRGDVIDISPEHNPFGWGTVKWWPLAEDECENSGHQEG